MPDVSFDLRLKDVRLSSDAQNSTYTIELAAHHTFSGFSGRRLSTGGHLEDLTGTLLIRRRGNPETSTNSSPGYLQYIPGNAEYQIDECYVINLMLPDESFNSIERWIRQGSSPTSVELFFHTSDAINDGPFREIDVDESWDNKATPEVVVESAHFKFRTRLQPESRLAAGHHSLEVWEGRTWERMYESATRVADSFYAEQENDYAILQRGRDARREGSGGVWLTRAVALDVSLRVAAYHCEHFDRVHLFGERVRHALEFLRRVRSELNPLAGEFSSIKNEYRLRLSEQERKADPAAWIWCHLDVDAAIRRGSRARDYWPIITDNVSTLCFEYLNQPWMEFPELEIAIADALTYGVTLKFGEAYRFFRWWSASKQVARFALLAFVGLAAAYSHGWWVGVLAAIVLWAALGHVRYSEAHRGEQAQIELLQEMISLCRLFNTKRVWPALIRDRLLATAKLGAPWPAGLIALVEHAANRNSAVWIT